MMQFNTKKFHASLLALLVCAAGCAEQVETEILAIVPEVPRYELEVVVPEVAVAWGMAFLPDGSILLTERSGELIHFSEGEKNRVEGLPEIDVRGQGGLMDIVLHPEYESNGWIYLSYSSPDGEGDGSNTAIMRAKLEGNSLVGKEVLYHAKPNTRSGRHFGSRMAFDSEGYLYFSVGDRGDRDTNSQDITRDGGKIYRIHDDGTIPSDNPFVGESGVVEAIFSYGHRNPQGMARHPVSGEIWIHEHGPRGGDEINVVRSGLNYGWPLVSYGINYSGTSFTDKTSMSGMEQPLFFWVPSIAPSGMVFVTSDVYPEWKNSLLVGALKFAYLERLVLEEGKVVAREKLFEGEGRFRDVRQGPDGYLYVSVEGKGILRIVPR